MSSNQDNLHPHPSNDFLAFAREEIEQSITDRFEQQAAEYAQRLAVKTRDHSLTYHQLNQWANRIAHTILAQRGEGAEPVGLLIEQGASLIASIIGVLKSGKMYLPMDPGHPAIRNSNIIHEAGASFILTDSRNNAGASDFRADHCSVCNIDEVDASSPTTNPRLPLTADTYAYIFYTSGSTGRPKGVYDKHRNVLHNIMRYTNSLHISSQDRLTLLQSAGFSGSVSSLFNSLLNGASVFPYDIRKDGMGRNIAEWLIGEEITVYHSVPAIFRSFLTGAPRFPKMRLIRLEGDAASRIDVELYKKYFEPECLLVNGLGATETGITRQFFINKKATLSGGIVPVGYPTADMRAIIVDDSFNEVSVGAIGEIAVKSRYLAAGYWKNFELTRSSFVHDPAGSDERMYRTGDMGRMREDGCLEYAGRKDFQLKVRGFRIELGEIEAILAEHPDVRQAAVHLWTVKADDARIVACCVPAKAGVLAPISLRKYLRARLPEYMVPQYFLLVDEIPLTPTGKVDRRRLPTPVVAESGIGRHEAPSDPVEATIAEIWTQLIHPARPIGRNDKFFEMGGHSLLGLQALGQMEHKLDVKLDFRVLFQENLADIATRCRSEIAGEGGYGGGKAAGKR